MALIPKRLVHIITGLDTGGAEMMLFKLLLAMDRNLFSPAVISLTDAGPVADKIRSLDIPVETLGMKRGAPNPQSLFRLVRRLRQRRPDLIQTWMYHSDLIGAVAAKMAGNVPLAWGVHNSNLDRAKSKSMTIWTARICARLSRRFPKSIVCCSEASRRVHALMGYDMAKMVVIPNGFDLSSFKPDLEGRRSIRLELGIPENTFVIGLVGRFDPQKDHLNFVRAAALFSQSIPNTVYLLCGNGVNWENRNLARWIDEEGLRRKFYLLGCRDDMPLIQASLDIAVSSSSYGEAFSNTICEAMACGVPCVVTDVGDSAFIVDRTGAVVPPGNAVALAEALEKVIRLSPYTRAELGSAARKRIMEHFSLQVIASRYEELYKELVYDNNKA